MNDFTDKELIVLFRAGRAMLARGEANLARPDPSWTDEDIRNIQYDIAVLTSALNRINKELKERVNHE